MNSGSSRRSQPSRPRRVNIAGRDFVMHGREHRAWQDLYHFCMTVSWPKFFATWAALFVVFNLAWAYLYAAVPGSVENVDPPGYLGAFFFSVETLATVGYGHMHPGNLYGHILASAEIFIGLTSLALVTGVMFARFSRPTARFVFSEQGVVRPMDGQPVLMLRAANARSNIVMEATAQLRMLRRAVNAEGYAMQRVYDLKLVRDQQPLFALGWNMMHVIDETSPLHGETEESLVASGAAFNLTLSGTDETTGQVLMARKGYPATAIRWNHSFRDIATKDPDGTEHFDIRKIHEVEPL